MAVINSGDEFPDFVAQGVDTAEIRKQRPLFVVIWKKGCSTCRLALPFYQRLHETYPGAAVIGISQDDSETVKSYCEEKGLTFPQVADQDDGLALTKVFRPETVPNYFYTDNTGIVHVAGEAWNADALNDIAARMGEFLGEKRPVLVPESEPIARFTPG